MDYQNKPIEWIESVEKVAKDKDDNLTNTGLVAGGIGAAAGGAMINHKPTSKGRLALKRALQTSGGLNVAVGTLGAAAGEATRRAAASQGIFGTPIATMAKSVRDANIARAGVGTAELVGSKFINTNPVSKKRLAAKLGLITGGVAAAAAGAHGLLKEKKASNDDYDTLNTVADASLVGSGLAALGVGATINPHVESKFKRGTKNVLTTHGTMKTTLGVLNAVEGERARRAYTNLNTDLPGAKEFKDSMESIGRNARNRNLTHSLVGAGEVALASKIKPTTLNKKRLAAKLGLITGGVAAAAAGAHGLINKEASKKEDKKPESGWKRFGKAIIGYPVAAISSGVAMGTTAALSSPANRRANIRRVLPFAMAANVAAHGNAAYQAYRYTQEH